MNYQEEEGCSTASTDDTELIENKQPDLVAEEK